jgi:2-oxo-4-hydroxy-4-carboxy-5-ureidoimidazoline decarboxylase
VSDDKQLRLEQLNEVAADEFVAALGGVFEHSPWVAETVCAARPFPDVDALHGAMVTAVRSAPRGVQIDLLRAHPELAGRQAREGQLTADSTSEQGGAGLGRLAEDEFRRFDELNRAYREMFGFPFIIAVKEHSKDSILASFETRLGNSMDVEIEYALGQVFRITRLRLHGSIVDPPATPLDPSR